MADIAITAASFLSSANASIVQGIAGATVTRGQALYYDSGTGTYKLFDANDVTADSFAGLACEDAATGQVFLVCTKDPALQLGGTLANGDTVWGSANAGAVTKTQADLASGWRIYVLGVCNGANNSLNFNPVRGAIK